MTAGRALAVALLALPAPVLAATAGDEGAATLDETVVGDFLLEASDGRRLSLWEELPGREVTVLAFTSTQCPITKLLAPRLGRIEREYRDRGVRFLGIDPNLQDSAAEVAEFARGAALEFPILLDPHQVVADRLGLERTTEVFVLDAGFRLLYRGAVDDQYSVGAARPAPNNDFLIDAIESALAGETIDPERTDAPGCLVGRVRRDASEADVTFFRDVAPVLWTNCLECHRPGQIGPMAFLDAEEAAGWAPMIAEVVADGRMPPWHADPRHGRFLNERRLTETEKRTLELWAASGAKPGDPAEAPPLPTFEDETWAIGRPDLVFELPEEQSIPAEGVVPYRYVVVDPGITEDRWVQAVEVMPGNRAVTHHVGTFLLPPGMDPIAALAGADGVGGGAIFAEHVPGGRPIELPDGFGKRLPKGSRVVFQLHYTPNGKAATDRTRVALRYSRVPVTHEVSARPLVNMKLDIPPHEPEAVLESTHAFRDAVEIAGAMPHMHLRGKAFRIEIERGGERSIVLDVPRYDFNWQHTYRFADPLAMAPGDRVILTAVFDNSAGNPNNPDPSKRVRWGDQTFEEMMVGYLTVVKELAAPAGPSGAE